MACNFNVKFGSDSKKAIREIQDKQDMANVLSGLLGMSVMLDIFARNGVIGSSYKVVTTDFELLGKSMHSSNPILVRQVENIAYRMATHSSITNQERMFWRCLYNEM
ncbi:hypothetical protein [Vibrio coralliilyticus]|uniref:hypothetical protein n=1 Tax=Vibrio coralliilyticus TaxID=190893 RepID=UPI000C1664F3|nr:hypothetical protein [Vibrio coralliilyticus]